LLVLRPSNHSQSTLADIITLCASLLEKQSGSIEAAFGSMRFNIPALEYSPTQPFTLPHFAVIVHTLGVIWTVLLTILNVAAVGYETVPIFSTSFNSSTPLWYERFVLTRWLFPASLSCSPFLIEPGQSSHSFIRSKSDM
jgi:hypothetical protein